MGVVCLADYKCCRKANPKEMKKGKATFVIEKGEVRVGGGRTYDSVFSCDQSITNTNCISVS